MPDPEWTYYVNKPRALHDAEWPGRKGDGFRPVSLCIHGSADAPVLSCVWVKRVGSDWDTGTFDDLPALEGYLETKRAAGYFPRLISAVGILPRRYAVMVEQGLPETRMQADFHGAFLGELVPTAEAHDEFPRSVSVTGLKSSGDAGDLRFAFVWEKQPQIGKVYWNGFLFDAAGSPDATKALIDGFSEARFAAPVLGTPAQGHAHYVMFDNDMIKGRAFHLAPDEATVHALMVDQARLGRWPLSLQAAGAPGQVQRFAMTFATHPKDQPEPRAFQLRQVGPSWSPPDPPPFNPFTAFDAWVEQLLREYSIRAGALAIGYGGRLVYAAGYTFAESGYPITEPTTLFKLASCSKPVAATAAMVLVDRGDLGLTETLADVLGISMPSDPGFLNRTVDHFLCHLGRFNNPDQFWDSRFTSQAVSDATGAGLPLAPEEIASFAAAQPDVFQQLAQMPVPGASPLADAEYSSFGYFLLGQMIKQRVQGAPNVEQAIRGILFERLGIPIQRYRSAVQRASDAETTTDEIRYHPRVPSYGSSSQVQGEIRPYCYDTIDMLIGLTASSTSMAVVDYARLLTAFDLSLNPLFTNPATQAQMLTLVANTWYRGFQHGAHYIGSTKIDIMRHAGAMQGVCSLAFRRNDGISFVLAINCDLKGGLTAKHQGELNDLADQIAKWPDWDLFSQVGIVLP